MLRMSSAPAHAREHRLGITTLAAHDILPARQRVPVVVEYAGTASAMTAGLIIRLVGRRWKGSGGFHRSRPIANALPCTNVWGTENSFASDFRGPARRVGESPSAGEKPCNTPSCGGRVRAHDTSTHRIIRNSAPATSRWLDRCAADPFRGPCATRRDEARDVVKQQPPRFAHD